MQSTENRSPGGRLAKRLLVGVLLALPVSLPNFWRYRSLLDRTHELQNLVTSVAATTHQSPSLHEQLKSDQQELASLRAQAVREDRVDLFRSELVALVRESECQLRQIHVGHEDSRPWHERDHPIASPAHNDSMPTSFELRTRHVSLSVVGSMAAILDCIDRLQQNRSLKCMQRVMLAPDDRRASHISFNVDMLVIDFVHISEQQFDNPL